jgi:hypothetical protein
VICLISVVLRQLNKKLGVRPIAKKITDKTTLSHGICRREVPVGLLALMSLSKSIIGLDLESGADFNNRSSSKKISVKLSKRCKHLLIN